MSIPFVGWVTACIPHFACQIYVRRAVESLLGQSYPWIRIIVINDADEVPPWRELASLRDTRLTTFSVKQNAGPYFCLELARRVTPDPYFLIQDADDWSAPDRVERLLQALLRDNSDFAVSAQPQVIEDGGIKVVEIRWERASDYPVSDSFIVQRSITPEYKYRSPHHGLFRSSSLRAIGGYYCGLRISHDTLIPNLILMTGRISHVSKRLYYRFIRPESLTHSASTGIGTANARHELRIQHEIYRLCYFYYERFSSGEISNGQLTTAIRSVCAATVPAWQQSALRYETKRLFTALRNGARCC
jgi:glycosyltransferase involved in cell wall biosynthesis